MAKDQPGPAQLVHHYTHVVCALNESVKGGVSDAEATVAINQTIVGVCKLIDSLVSQEHRDTGKAGMN